MLTFLLKLSSGFLGHLEQAPRHRCRSVLQAPLAWPHRPSLPGIPTVSQIHQALRLTGASASAVSIPWNVLVLVLCKAGSFSFRPQPIRWERDLPRPSPQPWRSPSPCYRHIPSCCVLGFRALSVPGIVCVLTCFFVELSLLPEKKSL